MSALPTSRAVAGLAAAALTAVCSAAGARTTGTGAGVRLVPVPASVVQACRRAQAQVRFTVLCPASLPRPSVADRPGAKPDALGAIAAGGTVDVGYSAPRDTSGATASANFPARFLHFTIGPADRGVPEGARVARLGGREGLLAAAVPGEVVGRYFANHVRFVFKAGGVDYAATLHTFGESATEALLGRIVATLRPARSLRVAARPGAIAVPAGPSSIATRGRFLWVVSTGTIESASPLANRLSRVDPATGAVTPVSGLGIRSVTAAVGPSAVWATYTYNTPDGNFAPPVLARVDPAHPHVISRLRLSRDGSDLPIASAAGPGSIWVGLARATEGSVVRVDPATRRIVARVALPVRPNAVVAALGRLWVAGGATLIAIDARTSQIVATTRVGPGASAVAAASGALWVAAAGDGTVSRVDARTYRVTARVPLGGPCYGLAASRGTVWAALPGAGTVVRLDARSGRIVRRIDVGGDPLAVAAAGGGGPAWVTMLADGVVLPVR